jgi:hypothetical protein
MGISATRAKILTSGTEDEEEGMGIVEVDMVAGRKKDNDGVSSFTPFYVSRAA